MSGDAIMDAIWPWVVEHKWWFAPLACFVVAIVVVKMVS